MRTGNTIAEILVVLSIVGLAAQDACGQQKGSREAYDLIRKDHMRTQPRKYEPPGIVDARKKLEAARQSLGVATEDYYAATRGKVYPTLDIDERLIRPRKAKSYYRFRSKGTMEKGIAARDKAVEEAYQNLATATTQLNDAVARAPKPFKSFSNMKAGTVGYFPYRIIIFQVLDEKKALIQTGIDGKLTLFLLRGVSTENWVDGKKLYLNDTFVISGTHQYTQAGGGTNTVFVMEPKTDEKPKPKKGK